MPVAVKAIHRQMKHLDQKKQSLLQILTKLTEEEYFRQPSPDSWSVAQAANHIYLSERYSMRYIQKKLSFPDTLAPFHPKSWASVLLLKIVLFTPYKAKAPKIINMWEDQPLMSPASLNEEWMRLRTELFECVKNHYPQFGSYLVYKHPFAGRLTLHQMLIFLNDHMAHHIRQINKILKKTKRPA